MKKLALFLMLFLVSLFAADPAWSDDPEAPCATAIPVVLDSSGQAQVAVSSGMTIEINVTSRGGLWVIDDTWTGTAELRNAGCEVLSSGAGREYIVSAQISAGTYYIEIIDIFSSTIQIIFNEDDHGDTFASATQITVGNDGTGTVSGTTDGGFDYDYFQITNSTPGILTASLSYDGVYDPPILELYDSSHVLVAEDFTSSDDEFVSISIDVSPGDYFASVFVDPLFQYEYTLNVQFEWDTGSLKVDIDPSAAVSAGAQWQVDGGAWRNSGSTANDLTVGNHSVQFKNIAGWAKPGNRSVVVENNRTTSTSAQYTQQTGSLTITITPVLAASAGAQWKVDDGEWQTSGSTVTGLSVGIHLVEFNGVADWLKPSTATITIVEGQETSSTGEYTAEDNTPPQIVDVLPIDGAGIDHDIRVPSDVSFAVRLSDEYGIDISQADAVVIDISHGGDSYSHTIDDDLVRIVKLIETESDASLTDLWAVYDKTRESDSGNGDRYPYDTTISITVAATDKYGNTLTSKVFQFKTETEDEHDNAVDPANLPETTTQAGANYSTVEVLSGNLEGVQLIYANAEPTQPGFGPEYDDVPELDIAYGIGWPLNLQPPTVFNEPVTIVIPCIGYSDVSGLSIYYFDGAQWKLACDASGNIQAGGEGWIVPESRTDYNYKDDPVNNDPSRIEIQVYHFSGLQVGANTPQTGSLEVTIDPQEAVDEGARWRVDQGDWRDSGYTEANLDIGSHMVAFENVTGWTAPDVQTVVVTDGQTVSVSGTYTEDGEQSVEGDPSSSTSGGGGGGGGGCFIGLLVGDF